MGGGWVEEQLKIKPKRFKIGAGLGYEKMKICMKVFSEEFDLTDFTDMNVKSLEQTGELIDLLISHIP